MPFSHRVVKTLLFVLFIGPGPVIGFVPWLLAGWRSRAPHAAWIALGALFVVAGAIPLGESIVRFVRQGHGTPAPWAPTDRLIVSGFYPYVRNPMYIGVLLMIFGQAVLLWDGAIVVYGAIAALGFHLFVISYEEPFLRRRYGDAYQEYCRRVRRWWPRIP